MIPVEIPPNTIMFRGISLDSNIYLVKDGNEGLMIDTGTGSFFNSYKEIMEREGYLYGIDKMTILNTHEHFDHVGGNLLWRDYFESLGMKVIFASHENTSKSLEEGDDRTILSYYYGVPYQPHKIDIKLKNGDSLRIGSLEFKVIHTPGHTRGSICLYEPKEMLLFTGDTVFYHSVGRPDMPTGNFEELIESIARLEKLQVYLGLPGHGKIIQHWDKNMEIIKDLMQRYI
ncbi:MBL fold metallo-hydrolase [Palaeococcus pacificus]|nr:MBL fold metallo-hydrolase [Palaeococcus pacificus]